MTFEEIRDVVAAGLAASGLNKHRAATEMGLPADAIRSILRGHDPKATRLADVCRALGLEFYVGPPRSRTRTMPRKSSGSVVAYPVEAAEITGGASPSGCMLFTATFLREFELDPTHLLAVEIDDDNMAPLLPAGGCAVADRRKRDVAVNGIFALDGPTGEKPILRRAVSRDSGGFEFRCDRADRPLTCNVGADAVIGQVVWASRMEFELHSPWQY